MSSENLIINQETKLSEIIKSIIKTSQNLYFLVGYFYFSGFEEIFEELKDKNIKILVGMDIERDMMNKFREVELLHDLKLSNTEIKENYYNSLTSFINNSDFLDYHRGQEAFKVFVKKIEDGSLQIRKTTEPNHAKVYLFENDEEHNQMGTFPGTLITGSSNLTFSGLKGRFELDAIFRDQYYKEVKAEFDKLWKESVNIASIESKNDFLINVVKKVWIDKIPDPYLVYVRVLKEFFEVEKRKRDFFPSIITKEKYYDLKYQIDAIAKAISTVEKHNGVIISDVVGLGKSIIASAVAHSFDLKTIIIAPPHLIQQWDEYRMDFDYNAKVYSSGKIKDALEENSDNEEKMIIIDEAHRYRNESTQDYADLHKLCQGNKVILLTATPYNNKPQDIFSLIKLFQIPAKSTLQTVDNLSYRFIELIKEYKEIESDRKKNKDMETIKNKIEKISLKIRNLISPLVIRRSRIDLQIIEEYKKDLENQKISFPVVNDPVLLEYDLGDLSELYKETLEKISPSEGKGGFKGTRYKPVLYLKNIQSYEERISKSFGNVDLFRQAQLNLAMFMRRHLVTRFESSMRAFQISLNNMIDSMNVILKWYENVGEIPIYKKGQIPEIEDVLEDDGTYMFEEAIEIRIQANLKSLKEEGYEFINVKEIKKSFKDDLEEDIRLLEEIRDEWFKSGVRFDPKLDSFKKLLKKQLKEDPERKIVVFSQFEDTVDYLFENLKDELSVLKYSGSNSTEENRKRIIHEFDASSKIKNDKFKVLITTDAISEGFNLNRAGTIFNYDIPYNPTRVIQRIGRINRINKKIFDELYIYNFFPTVTGEEETSLKKISTLKLAMINSILGEDTKVLTSEDELRSFFNETYKEKEEISWDSKYIDFLKKLETTHPEIVQKALEIPKRTRIRRTVKKVRSGIIIFGKKGSNYIFKISDGTDIKMLSDQEAIGLFEAEVNEKSQIVGDNFDEIYQNLKQNLFTRKTQNNLSQSQIQTLNNINYLIKTFPNSEDYLKDLKKVIVDYNSLPEKYERMIKNIKIDHQKISSNIEGLKKEIPEEYLQKIINRANQITEESETIILSEELI